MCIRDRDIFFNAGLGFEQLWSVSISENAQVNLDYANQGETQIAIGETIELDPIFTSGQYYMPWGTTSLGVKSANSATTNCSVPPYAMESSGSGWVESLDSGNGGYYCNYKTHEWDISFIPDGATITDVKLTYTIKSNSYNNPNKNCTWKSMEVQPSSLYPVGGTPEDIWDDILDGTTFYANDSNCQSGGFGEQHKIDLGGSADSDLQANLGDDWWAVGVSLNPNSRSTTAYIGIDRANIEVKYTSLPDPPANLTSSQSLPNQVELDWTDASPNGDFYIGNKAVTYENDSNGNDGIDCPATWVLWQGGATPTCPTLGGSTDSQMIVGTHATFNGTTDAIGNTLLDAGTSANNGGVAYTCLLYTSPSPRD